MSSKIEFSPRTVCRCYRKYIQIPNNYFSIQEGEKSGTGYRKEYLARIPFRKKAETRTNTQKIEHIILTPHSFPTEILTPIFIPTEMATKIHEDARNSPLSVREEVLVVSNMTQEPLNIPEIDSIILDETTTLDNSNPNDNSETTVFNVNAAQIEAERR